MAAMRKREGIAGQALEFAVAVRKMVAKAPGGAEENDPVAAQLNISSVMIGPKYAGIVSGLDRGHTLYRLDLCCGNADEAVYWLEYAATHWPQLAEEAKELREEGLAIASVLHRRKEAFLLHLDEIDGEKMPWAERDWDADDEDEDWSSE